MFIASRNFSKTSLRSGTRLNRVRPPPQWGYRASPRDKPIYSRDDIINASRAFMKGAYKGREAEYEALQADIIRAGAEGRIIGGVPLEKKSRFDGRR